MTATPCHYCRENPANRVLVWLHDELTRPREARVAWCGCLLEPLNDFNGNRFGQPVQGIDYRIEPLPDPTLTPPRVMPLTPEQRAVELMTTPAFTDAIWKSDVEAMKKLIAGAIREAEEETKNGRSVDDGHSTVASESDP